MKGMLASILIIFALNSTSVYSLTVGGSNTKDIYSGDTISWLYANDSSALNIYGGDISWLYANDSSTLNISGGDISWLYANNNSQVNITNADDLGWLLVNDNSQVNIFGSNFSYSGGLLSGAWNNGVSFLFWSLEEADLNTGSFGNILPDNVLLHTVPIPAAAFLFGTALIGLIGCRRKYSNKLLQSDR